MSEPIKATAERLAVHALQDVARTKTELPGGRFIRHPKNFRLLRERVQGDACENPPADFGGKEFVEVFAYPVDGNGEVDVFLVRVLVRDHTYLLAQRIDQGATRVPEVAGGVELDEAVSDVSAEITHDQSIGRGEDEVGRTHDARRVYDPPPAWVACAKDGLARHKVVASSETEGIKWFGCTDLEQAQVLFGHPADDFVLQRELMVFEEDDPAHAGHYVVVGQT